MKWLDVNESSGFEHDLGRLNQSSFTILVVHILNRDLIGKHLWKIQLRLRSLRK